MYNHWAILAIKTKGLTVTEGFDNLRILYISQALYLHGCKAFFIGYLTINVYISNSKNECQDGTQYHSTTIL